jgi:hypothetical protein
MLNMAITIELPSGNRVSLDDHTILIGQDRACQIALPEERSLRPQHAKIIKVANRWLIESLGDWFVQVGEAAPGRKQWIKPGDSIRLAEQGPIIVFEPSETSGAPIPAASAVRETSPNIVSANLTIPANEDEPPPLPPIASDDEPPPLPTFADADEPPPLPPIASDDEPPPLPLDSSEEPPPLPDGLSGKDLHYSRVQLAAAPTSTPSPAVIPSVLFSHSKDNVPKLWNPMAAGKWSVLFHLVCPSFLTFGSFLLAQNWKALGDPVRSRRSMFWFYSIIPWLPFRMLTIYLMPIDYDKNFVKNAIFGIIHLAIWEVPYFIWAFAEVNPQARFVEARFGDQYPRRSWFLPILIGVCCCILAVGLFLWSITK